MIELPPPIAAYFQADSGDAVSVSECFAAEAVVKDEGNDHKGRPAIQKWKEEASRKFKYTVEPFAIEKKDDKTIVTAFVAGDFPGSPVDLRYFFTTNAEKITSLEIKP